VVVRAVVVREGNRPLYPSLGVRVRCQTCFLSGVVVGGGKGYVQGRVSLKGKAGERKKGNGVELELERESEWKGLICFAANGMLYIECER
jgi:hypothetical protein